MQLEFQAYLNKTSTPDHIFINIKKQAISVSINTFTVYTFDLSGRVITVFKDGRTFRRSLDNRIMEKWSISKNGSKQRVRKWLNLDQRKALVHQVLEEIKKILSLLMNHQIEINSSSDEDSKNIELNVEKRLEEILHFDFACLEKDAQSFSSIYQHLGILPPDMYLSIVLQATNGCSYNQCNYCNFYKGEPFYIKSLTEFEHHIQEVKNYFAESLPLRKFIFLGEANALDISQSVLLKFFNAINQQFNFSDSDLDSGLPKIKGIYSFLTSFHKNPKSVEEVAELRAQNLRGVYFGMATGSDELLHFLNKPGKIENGLRLVEVLKSSGVQVGIIVLLGAGGKRYYHSHTHETIRAINEMDLNSGDVVFFSPITNYENSEYEQKSLSQNIQPLSEEEVAGQKKEMIEGLKFQNHVSAPKLALYDVDEFIY